jgi:N,N'-diacetylchitobiose transport system permease protein
MSRVDAATPDLLAESGVPSAGRPDGRRRPGGRTRTGRGFPYLLLLPALAILFGVLGYPVAYLLRISFQRFDQAQLFGSRAPEWIGIDNYRDFVADPDFAAIVARTLGFTFACVALTVIGGLGIAMLLERISAWVRIPLLIVMIFAWAMPLITSVQIFRWLFEFQYGVVNWLLTQLPGVDFTRHHWFTDSVQGFSVITAMIVWQALPFVAVTLYAGLTQVPQELIEAARIDGAGRWAVFRNVTYPVIRPVLIIVTTLSIIWDFQVVVHILAMLAGTPSEDYYTLPLYSYMTSFVGSYFGLGAAAAVITVLALIGVSFVYIRQFLRLQEVD